MKDVVKMEEYIPEIKCPYCMENMKWEHYTRELKWNPVMGRHIEERIKYLCSCGSEFRLVKYFNPENKA